MSVRSMVPLYYRIYLDLKQSIVDRVWATGEEIPTELELQKKYGCARETVRRAIDGLVQDGLVVRKRGSGTFVAESRTVQPVGRIYSTSETIRARGETPSTRLISLETVDSGRFRKLLQLPDAVRSVYILRRLRLSNGSPLSVVTTFIPADLVPDFESKVTTRDSLYELYECDYGFRMTQATQVISACGLTKEEAGLLNCQPGDPALKVERTTYLDTGRIVEFICDIFRHDRFSISVNLIGRDSRMHQLPIDPITPLKSD